MLLHFFAKLTFDLRRACYQVGDTSEVVDEFCGCLLSDTRTTRKVVGRIAHECE